MQAPSQTSQQDRLLDRTISVGQFAVALLVLILAIAGSIIQSRIQAAVADERITELTTNQSRMQLQLDAMQSQNTSILQSVSRMEGGLNLLNRQLTSVNDKK